MKLRFSLVWLAVLAFGLSACGSSATPSSPPPSRQTALNEFSDDWVLFANCLQQADTQNQPNSSAQANAVGACIVNELKDLQNVQVPTDTQSDLQTFENHLQQTINTGSEFSGTQTETDYNKVEVDLGGSPIPSQVGQSTPTP